MLQARSMTDLFDHTPRLSPLEARCLFLRIVGVELRAEAGVGLPVRPARMAALSIQEIVVEPIDNVEIVGEGKGALPVEAVAYVVALWVENPAEEHQCLDACREQRRP